MGRLVVVKGDPVNGKDTHNVTGTDPNPTPPPANESFGGLGIGQLPMTSFESSVSNPPFMLTVPRASVPTIFVAPMTAPEPISIEFPRQLPLEMVTTP